MISKLDLKKGVTTALHHLGLLNRARDRVSKRGAFILMYHRILPGSSIGMYVQPGMYVYVGTFKKHMRFVKEYFSVVPLAELVARLQKGQSLSGYCAITFDDGWLDNYTHAFPILQELQVPATIYLATGMIGTEQLFWPEELCFYLQNAEIKKALKDSEPLRDFFDTIDKNSGTDELYDRVIAELKTWEPDARQEVIRSLRESSTVDQPGRVLLNWEEVSRMAESGLINFGAHTANHVILDQVSTQEAEAEILQSKKHIQDKLGEPVEHFAYPNGNFTPDLKILLHKHGFTSAVTTKKHQVEPNVDLFALPRIGMHQDVSSTIPLFQARMLFRQF